MTLSLPDDLRWVTGGGSPFGGCNRHHIAPVDTRGTLCGLYGPATPQPPRDSDNVCKSCLRIMALRIPRAAVSRA